MREVESEWQQAIATAAAIAQHGKEWSPQAAANITRQMLSLIQVLSNCDNANIMQ